LAVYTYEVRLVNSCCFHKTVIIIEAIDGVHLPSLLSKIVCLYETTIKVDMIVRVYI
jgi:hypothetical protein